jgi:hypothetical protein
VVNRGQVACMLGGTTPPGRNAFTQTILPYSV